MIRPLCRFALLGAIAGVMGCASAPPAVDPADAIQLSDTQLAANFMTIATRNEFVSGTHPLVKWREPIRMRVLTDDPHWIELAARNAVRIQHLTGHPIGFVGHNDPSANVTLFSVPFNDAEAFRSALAERGIMEVGQAILRWSHLLGDRDFCFAGYATDEAGAIASGMIVVSADIDGGILPACIEEEMVQLMGLPNDNDRVRPSIFNDDQEFRTMTWHDELLLQVLYDDRLRIGMSADEAAPLVRQIIAEKRQAALPAS